MYVLILLYVCPHTTIYTSIHSIAPLRQVQTKWGVTVKLLKIKDAFSTLLRLQNEAVKGEVVGLQVESSAFLPVGIKKEANPWLQISLRLQNEAVKGEVVGLQVEEGSGDSVASNQKAYMPDA
jgi:hypothetical protein